MEVDLEEFIDIKGWKAMGNKLGEFKVTGVEDLTIYEVLSTDDVEEEGSKDENPVQVDLFSSTDSETQAKDSSGDKFVPGDEIDLDV